MAARRELLPHLTPRYCASISAVLFGIGSSCAITPGEDVGRLAEVVDREPVALLAERELGIESGQQTLCRGIDQARTSASGAKVQHEEHSESTAPSTATPTR